MKSRTICVMVLIIIMITNLFLLTGCSELNVGAVEIGKAFFVRVAGVDKKTNGGEGVRVTTIAKKNSPSENVKSGEEGATIVNSEGRTIFEAVRGMHTFMNKDPFWGHTEFILMSEDAAREDITKYLDFFVRDHEMRLNSKVLVVKGETAEEFMKKSNTSDGFIADSLSGLFEETGGISVTKKITLSEALVMFDNRFVAPLLPCIELTNVISKNKDDSKKSDIIMRGYAIFKDDSMFEFVTDDTARGINWVREDVKSGIIVVKDKSDKNVSLEIINSSGSIKPEIKNGVLSLSVDIKAKLNLDEQVSNEDLLSQSEAAYLENQAKNAIQSEIQKAINITQPNGLDVFGIADVVYHKYPLKWEKLQDNWENIYKGTPISVKVETKIERVYLVENPVERKPKE